MNCVLPDLSRDLLFRVSFHVVFHRLYSASKSAFPTLVSLSISAFSSGFPSRYSIMASVHSACSGCSSGAASAVVLIRLALYESKIERNAALFVKPEHDSPVVAPVSAIQMNKARTGERRLLPCLFHISETTLDGRRAYTMCNSQFGNSLLAVLIGTPEAGQCHFMAVAELIPAFSTYI